MAVARCASVAERRCAVRGVGAERQVGPRRRRLGRLGRRRHVDAAGKVRCVGGHRQVGRDRVPLQVRRRVGKRQCDDEGRPDGIRDGVPTRDRQRGGGAERPHVDRRVVDVDPRARAGPAVADLRDAPRLVASWSVVVPRVGPPSSRPRRCHGVHARRVAAGRRASLRWFVGLSSDRVLRTHSALRHARRLPRVRRRVAPTRHRRDPRLGAGSFPPRRVEPGPVRRHQALRTLRPPTGRASRLGHARVQLRPSRGAQLPDRQRPVLAAGVPHRRIAGRRCGQHVVPRLLA